MIEHEQIETTSAKARAIRGIFEKLITKARLNTVHSTRQVHDFVQSRSLVHKLVHEIAPRYLGVKGGYTKLTMIGNRRGDNAPIVRLELTKKNTKESVGASSSRPSSKKVAKKKLVKKPVAKPSAKPSPTSAQPVKTRSTSSVKATTHVRKQGDR
jgi:large subunit ribosomal protein L17